MDISPEAMSQLSPETLAALMEFYQEKNQAKEKDEDGFDKIEEDWELSQFWYNKETADKIILLIGNYAKKIKKKILLYYVLLLYIELISEIKMN